jgi:hypothetical protein
MATATQIADLRSLINEPTEDTFTDVVLGARIDALGPDADLRPLAATIWREKAAQFAGLVDIKEGNSDRKLSQLYRQALDMATSLGGSSEDVLVGGRPTRTRKIERM